MTKPRQVGRIFLRSAVAVAAGGVVLAAALLATGSASESPRAITAAAQTTPRSGAPLTPAELRLAEWPGLRGDLVRDELIYADEYRSREQLIRSCMRDRGFTYVPVPLEYGPMAPGNRPDPNARIVGRLAPDQQRAYFLALANSTSADDVRADFDLETPGRAGCIGEAHQALPGIFRVPAELDDAVAETRADASDDPGVVAAVRGWRGCVATELGGAVPDGLEQPADVARVSDLGLTNGPGEPTTVALEGASERCRGDLDQAFEAALVRSEAAFVRAHRGALQAHRETLVADHRAFGLSTAELQ